MIVPAIKHGLMLGSSRGSEAPRPVPPQRVAVRDEAQGLEVFGGL